MSLPSSDWSAFQPAYESLLAEELTAAGVPVWLERWSGLVEQLMEINGRLSRAYSENTLDVEAEARVNHLIEHVIPQWKLADNALDRKLLAVEGFVPDLETELFLRSVRVSAQIFRPENVPLEAELDRLENEYSKIVGGLVVVLDGEELTVPKAQQRLLEVDRARRESAWRAVHVSMRAVREELNALFLKIVPLRRALAKNAGLANFRDLMWLRKKRFDYSPDDCVELHASLLERVVPLTAKLMLRRQESLKLESVRPWDVSVDPLAQPPLMPFVHFSDLEAAVQRILAELNPEFAQHFASLRDGFLDLESRKGKSPGGYCDYFPVSKRPYIFMNAVGSHDDVQTLLHEAGHAIHALESANAQGLVWNFHGPMEFCEVAAMGMEMLGQPYLGRDRGGFYSSEDANRARREHLQGVVDFLPYMSVVDAFQQWLYSDAPELLTSNDLDAKWDELYQKFRPSEDWTGLEEVRASGWQRKQHIFTSPLYYVEYGIAQLGALQLWQNAQLDGVGTVQKFRAALRLGKTRGLRDLFAAAGIRLAFDADTIGDLMNLVEAKLEV
jgi:oligoendopeptidase F